jgi:hypothetical protein
MHKRNSLLRFWRWCWIAFGLTFLPAQLAHAEKMDQLHIHRFEPPEIRAFATSLVRKWLRENYSDAWRVATPPGWSGRLIDLVDVGEIILFDDSFVLLFLQITAGGCGTAGCDTYIYRETSKGFVKICEATMDEDPIFLKARENGYHLIDAGESIIHWSKVRDKKTGDLCYIEGKPGSNSPRSE